MRRIVVRSSWRPLRALRVIGTQHHEPQGVDVGLHQRAQSSIDHAMALDGALAGKATRENAHLEMPAAVARPRVSDMATAVVDDLELFGVELRFELASDQRDALGGHGAT